jgi:hypothetical protein
MEGLAYAIHNKAASYPEGPIVSELESFTYEYKPGGVRYTAPEGLHDDCVCALALAVMCKANAPVSVTIWGGDDDRNKDTFATGYDPMEDDEIWDELA